MLHFFNNIENDNEMAIWARKRRNNHPHVLIFYRRYKDVVIAKSKIFLCAINVCVCMELYLTLNRKEIIDFHFSCSIEAVDDENWYREKWWDNILNRQGKIDKKKYWNDGRRRRRLMEVWEISLNFEPVLDPRIYDIYSIVI